MASKDRESMVRSSVALPAVPTRTVGRQGELAAAKRLILEEDVRLLTIVGPPGIGKTRLAVELARAITEAYERVVFVDLSPITDSAFVVPVIAKTLRIGDAWGQSLLAHVASIIGGQRILLILDNFEQVIGAAAQIGALLEAAPRLTFIVTTRIPLRLRWEQEFAVAPLDVPRLGPHETLEALQAVPAVSLFASRARAVRPDFAVTEENAPAVASICRALEGVPLALELAATRLKVLSPAELAERLARPLEILSRGVADLPRRQQSLRDAIAWSHGLLSAEEQTLFRRLGVFVGGLTTGAVEAICKDGLPWSTLDGLAALVDCSLIGREDRDGRVRFRMLEALREYALEQLRAAGEDAEYYRRHATHFGAMAQEGGPEIEGGPEQSGWLSRIEVDLDNIRAALAWAAEGHDPDLGLRVAASLLWFWFIRGYRSEGRAWLDRMLVHRQGASTVTQAWGLYALGFLTWHLDEYHLSTDILSESLALFRDVGDPAGIATVVNSLGYVARLQGDYARARDLNEEGLAIFRTLGDVVNTARSLTYLAWTAQAQGDLDAATSRCEEAVGLFREARYPGGTAYALALQAYCLTHRGAARRAAALAGEALNLARMLGYHWAAGLALHALGLVHLQEGEAEQATRLIGESLRVLQEQASGRLLVQALEPLSRAVTLLGDARTGAVLLGAASALRETIGLPVAPVDRPALEQQGKALWTSLGDKAFGRAWERGVRMTVEEIRTLAMAPTQQEGSGLPVGSVRSGELGPPVKVDRHSGARRARGDALSPRERQVAALVSRGLTNREIALTIGITEGTAESHVQHILNKLGVRSRAEIAAWAAAHGLISSTS